NASLTCDPLGIYHLPLDTSRSSHLVLDLEVMAEYMYNVEFQVQLVSFFTQNVHYDYSNHAQEEPAQESGLAHQQDETSANPQPSEEALVTEDKWVLNDTRATKFEYEDGTSQQKVDNWRGKDAPKVVRQEKPWKGTTIFKVKPGGFERRTNVRVSISVGNRRGDVDEEIYVPDSVHEPSSSSRKPPSGGSSNDEVPGGKPLPGGSFNDEGPGPSQRREQKKREGTPVAKEDTSLEPRRVELPLPGQELSAASPRLPEDRTATQLRTIAMKAHLEARQSTGLKKDLAKRVMPSDGANRIIRDPRVLMIRRFSILLFQEKISVIRRKFFRLVLRHDGPSGPSAGAVPQYSDPDVPLSHQGTSAPTPSYPPDDPRRLRRVAGRAFQLRKENFPLLSLLSRILRGNRLHRIQILILMPPLTMKVEAQPNSADKTAEIAAGSSTEEEADFCHFLESFVVKDPSVTSGHTEERSVEDYPDIAHALTTRKDVNDIMFTGQRVAWVVDDKTKKKKKYI
ncbi:unnamed protein product, partial [Symbiodinium pilosum]